MSPQLWAGAAAGLYLAGLAVLFGLRTWQHQRATGDSGFRTFDHRDGWSRAAGLLFALAVLVGVLALLLTAAGVVPVLVPLHLLSPLALLGLLLALSGFALAWLAQSAMGDSWRIGVDPSETTPLVTEGIFGNVRNPVFTAMIAAQTGTALMSPSWLSVLGLAALVMACQLQVRRVEEPYLRATHGAAYLDYTTGAGRFVLLLGRGQRPADAATAARKVATK